MVGFLKMEEEARAFRALFNERYRVLPRVQYQERWSDAKGCPVFAVTDRSIDTPASSTSPDGRRVLILPLHDLDSVVLYDKWAGRGDRTPVEFAYPMGFDMVDAPYETMRRSIEAVRNHWKIHRNPGNIGVSDIIMPSFQSALLEAGQGWGKLVSFAQVPA